MYLNSHNYTRLGDRVDTIGDSVEKSLDSNDLPLNYDHGIDIPFISSTYGGLILCYYRLSTLSTSCE